MRRHRANGVITVFFTLISACFIGLIFMLLESARIQGARAQAANVTNLGGFSVFGEYEKKLLEKYEVFGVDGAYGSGDFAIGRVNDKLRGYMDRNLTAEENTLEAFAFDPWILSLTGTQINRYTLLTDWNCECFYQQAVAYMKETPVTGITARLYKFYTDAKDTEKDAEKYEKDKEKSDHEMISILAQQNQQEQALDQAADGEHELTPEELAHQQMMEEARQEAEKAENPLKTIAKLLTTPVLQLVCPGADISDGSVGMFGLCSMRWGNKQGNLAPQIKYKGLIDNLLFREYLLDHFGNYFDHKEVDGPLKYQLEYIIGGKRSDRDNLKTVAKKLIKLRCGCNYASCLADEGMQLQGEAMAGILIGWTGIPALVEGLKHAILLGWSYAESLMDVRALYAGGRVPLRKTSETWQLSLTSLAHADELLRNGSKGCGEGMKYKSYLRILLNLQIPMHQKIRATDMAEAEIRAQDGLSAFRADYCVVAVQYKTKWHIDPVFDRVTGALLGVVGPGTDAEAEGGFAY